MKRSDVPSESATSPMFPIPAFELMKPASESAVRFPAVVTPPEVTVSDIVADITLPSASVSGTPSNSALSFQPAMPLALSSGSW